MRSWRLEGSRWSVLPSFLWYELLPERLGDFPFIDGATSAGVLSRVDREEEGY